MADAVVVDASAVVDLLAGTEAAPAVADRLAGCGWHAPAHLDAEVLGAFGRMHRGGRLGEDAVEAGLGVLAVAPITRHRLGELLAGAWRRRHALRLVDGLYVELAETLGIPLLTTDAALARASAVAEMISP